MTAHDAVAAHRENVRELARPGGPLNAKGPHATISNEEWFTPQGRPLSGRADLHDRLIADYRTAHPDVAHNRQAIVLAGPPGAGKSTALHEIVDKPGSWLTIDADEFKRALLHQALEDGSYETHLKPDAIHEREQAGEPFFPLELASLVHEESSLLAARLRHESLDEGANVIIDTVLSSSRSAVALGTQLDAAGYGVQIIDVEVPYELSQARISKRWEHSYAAALEGRETLGGRWVPSEYAREVFDAPDDRSRPEVAAQMLAQTCPAVTRYRRFRTEFEGAERVTEVDQIRTTNGGPLIDALPDVDVDAMAAVRAAFPSSALSTSGRAATATDPQPARRAGPQAIEPGLPRG